MCPDNIIKLGMYVKGWLHRSTQIIWNDKWPNYKELIDEKIEHSCDKIEAQISNM